MSDDIVTTLRRESFYRPTSRLNSFGMPQMGFELTSFGIIAADEIERLRRELGQVSDADSWVSKADAAHLDSLLNWCEFADMESHRALQRLVNDRARLRGEVTRLRGGGCARDQTTTQFCAEAVFLQGELDTSRKRCRDLMIRQGELDAEIRKLRSEVG